MIVGDPSCFAIYFDKVEAWSSAGGYNLGFFCYAIDGVLIPNPSLGLVSTLNSEIHYLKIDTSFSNHPEDEYFFSLPKSEAFQAILNITSPGWNGDENENELLPDNDWSFKASTPEMEQCGYYVFTIKHMDVVRVIAGKYIQLTGDDTNGIVGVF